MCNKSTEIKVSYKVGTTKNKCPHLGLLTNLIAQCLTDMAVVVMDSVIPSTTSFSSNHASAGVTELSHTLDKVFKKIN